MSGLSAIVIDDNDLSRNLLAEIFKEKKIRVSTYSDPTDFLREHESDSCIGEKPCFDFILTDNKMPLMTGLAFLEHINRKGCLIPKAQTAIISGDWLGDDIKKAQELGCRIFSKPCPIEEIFAWVDNV